MTSTNSSHSGSITQSQLVKLAHTWKIENFSIHLGHSSVSTYIDSSEVLVPFESKNKFKLALYPNGIKGNSKHLSVFLEEISRKHHFSMIVKCKFAIISANGFKHYQTEVQKEIYSGVYRNITINRVGLENFASQSSILSQAEYLLPDDKLTIFAEISYFTNEKTTVAFDNQASIGLANESQLLENYANLLKSEKFSDVAFLVSGIEFRVHKAILSARSPVFYAMFENDLEEKKKNRVQITDVKSEVFEQLLSYIYTGKIDSIEQNTEDLLAAADKYQLIALKSDCEQYLCTKVSVESAPNLLLLADSFNANKLKTNVLDFMKRQSHKTIQAMMEANPELLVDMFRYLAIKSEKLNN